MEHNFTKIDENEWITIYTKIKHQNTYKFMYTDIDNYVNRITSMLNQSYKHPTHVLKKAEHARIIYDLKANFLRIICDLNLLDLPNLAMSIEYVVEKLIDSIQEVFSSFIASVSTLRQLQTSTTNKNLPTQLCVDCQTNVHKRNIDAMMIGMTLGDHSEAIKQISSLNNQIEDLSVNFEDIELSLMIDEVLQGKDAIFNLKKHSMNTIYDEIAQYLQNIPQSVVNLSRQNKNIEIVQLLQASNISNQIETVLNQIIQKPIKKLIKRVLQYSKNIYKPGITNQSCTQTPYSEDGEKIRILEKQKKILQQEIEKVRTMKRQSEKQIIKMIDRQQSLQMKYTQLISKHSILENQNQRNKAELLTVRERLSLCENKKKEMGDKLIGDYTHEKSNFARTIRDLRVQNENMSRELKVLRRQRQQLFFEIGVSTEDSQTRVDAETQTSDPQFDINYQSRIGKSKKNSISRIIAMNKSNYAVTATEHFQHQQVKDEIIQNYKNRSSFSLESSKKSFQSIVQKRSRTIRQFARERNSLLDDDNNTSFQQQKSQYQVQVRQQKTLTHRSKIKSIREEDFSQLKPFIDSGYGGISIKRYSNFHVNHSDRKASHKGSVPSNQSLKYLGQGQRRKYKNNMLSQTLQISSGMKLGFSGRSSQVIVGKLNEHKKYDDQRQEQKAKVMQKILKHYQLLQNKGILEEINELIQFNTVLKKQGEIGHKKKQQRTSIVHKKIKSCIPNDPLSPFQSIEGTKLIVSHNNDKNAYNFRINRHHLSRRFDSKQNIMGKKQSIKFTQKQIEMIFISKTYMKYYENSEDVWGILNGTIMVDYTKNSYYTLILDFFKKMQTENSQLYEQCWKMVHHPLKYLLGTVCINKTEGIEKKVKIGANKVGMQRKVEGCKKLLKDPNKMRDTFQKLIRFHQITHQKCTHIENFLKRLGFDQKS